MEESGAERFSKEPTFKETPGAAVIGEFALALMALGQPPNVYPSGTAIIVAPNLALTARHVIEDNWRQFERESLEGSGDVSGTHALVMAQQLDSGLALWEVTKLWLSAHTDAAFLRLDPLSDLAAAHKWRIPRIDAAPPSVGERVVAFGYCESAALVSTTTEGTLDIEWADKGMTAVGEVTALFERGRDRVMLPWPSYAVSGRFGSGMSGGPVFNANGHLCGLVCSHLYERSEEPPWISYAISLWPIFATEIDIPREGHSGREKYPVLDLATGGFMQVRNVERVKLAVDGEGEPLRDEYGNLKVGFAL